MIYIIRDKATPAQIEEMLEMLQSYIKLAIDIARGKITPPWIYLTLRSVKKLRRLS